jgi:hypothetical protein
MAAKSIVLVIGVGRSGTSAITRVLSLSGCALPSSVLGATQINEKGMWEPTDIWRLNEEFMFRHGTSYGDPSMRLQDMSTDDREAQPYIRKVQSFLSGLDQDKVCVVKHPCITELMAFWLEAASREGVSIKVVLPIRHPQEVFASIAAMGRANGATMSVELSNAFWLKSNLLAERHSRNLPRVIVEYSSFLMNWRLEIDRVSKALHIDPKPEVPAIEDFLTADLQHHRISGPVVETFGYPWLTRVYAALLAAARDEEVDLETMDEIFHAYRANERTFRTALTEYRTGFDSIDPQKYQEMLDRVPMIKKGVDY